MRTYYLYRKANTYYFRLRTPLHFIAIMGKREFKCSLKTSCYHTAKKLALLTTPGILDLYALAQQIHNSMLSEYEKLRLVEALRSHKQLEIAATSEILQSGAERIAQVRAEMDSELAYYQTISQALNQDNYDDACLIGATSRFLSDAPARISYDFSSQNPEAIYLMKVAGQTLLQTYASKRKILAGVLPEIQQPIINFSHAQSSAAPASAPISISTSASDNSPALQDVIPIFLASKAKENIHIKNTSSYTKSLERFSVHVGQTKPLASITKKDITAFREHLTTLPKRKNSDDKLSRSYINTIIKKVDYFFNWCMDENYGITKNPCLKATFKNDAEADQRSPFSSEEIHQLFAGRIFRGQSKIQKTAYYWAPLIALHTGARIQEICQLTINDIKPIDGILCFQFRPGTVTDPKGKSHKKSFKNKPSERDVPIHSKLLELGFSEYLQRVTPGKGNQLFPSLVKNKANGFSHAVTKNFGEYKTSLGFGADKVFHSFRHTMVNNLKQLGVPEVAIKEIVGHEQEGTTMAVYARTYRMNLLRDFLEQFQPVINAKPFIELPIARKELVYIKTK